MNRPPQRQQRPQPVRKPARRPQPASDFFWFLAVATAGLVIAQAVIIFLPAITSVEHPIFAHRSLIAMGITMAIAGIFFYQHHHTTSKGSHYNALALSLKKANEELNKKVEEQRRMSRALRESEQKYRAIFENAGIGICQITPTGEWTNANKTMAQILGFEKVRDLLVDQPDLHGRLFVSSRVRKDWFARLETEQQHGLEARIRTSSGISLWVNMTGHAVRDPMGDIEHFECTMFDITERKRAEEDMVRTKEEADYANRSKSEFLANMSHELRTPLNAIIGFSEIIRDQLFGPVGQEQYVEYAGDIYDSGSLLLSLINDILDMSKIEAGKRELNETTMNLHDTLRSVSRLVAARAKEGRVKLTLSVPPDMPKFRGEERAIKQILTNLLTNAIKFTPEGGTVSLSAEIQGFDQIIITCKDSGIGMSEEEIPVALAPFGQIESALSRQHQGTGLGLPLTRALVELHDGILELHSKVGEGTTIILSFPATRTIKNGVPATSPKAKEDETAAEEKSAD